jgi:hypothetical protein
VPNLITDRGLWVIGFELGGNVRRLMYQSLIWPAVLGYDAGRLSAALDPKNSKSLADSLVDRVRRNVQLGRDLFRTEVLVDEAQTIELAGSELGDPRRHQVRRARAGGLTRRIVRSV